LGWPLLLVLSAMVIWLWQRALVRALAITAVVFAVLSLGDTLLVGRRGTGIPLPWILLGKIPLLDHVVTARFALVLIPIAGALLALAIELIRGIADVRRRRLAVLGLVAALLPILPVPIPARGRQAVPDFVTSGEWRNWVRPGTSLATVPLTSEEFPTAMEWQRSSSDFTLAGGYFLGPDPTGRARFGAQPRPTALLMRDVYRTGQLPVITPEMRNQFAQDVAYWNASALVLPNSTPSHFSELHQLMTSLAGPGRRVADVTVWQPPPPTPR
jgi:dolichyl-phosphate beta-glucosyltransferase